MFTVTDTSLSTRFPIYTRANVGEVFPDPVAPATRSLLLFESELGWRDAYIRMGAFETNEFPDDEFCILGVAGGYCYLNASVMRVFGERAPGLSWKAIDEQFFGAQPGIPDYVEQPGDIRPDLTAQLEQTFGWVFSITDVDQLDRLNDHKARTIDLRASRPDFSSMSDLELWEYAEALFPFHRELFQEHIFVTTLTTVPVGVIQTVATAVGRPDLIMPLIAGVGQVDSAEPSYAMWELSRLDPTSDEFASGFEQFRLDFGSRGPNEWEARSPTWDTHPNIALAAIDRMRLAGEDADPRAHQQQRASERAEAAETLLSIVEADPATHGQLAAAIAASGAWLPARERTKTNNIRLIQEVRVPLRELGRRFVERQVFDEIEDFGLVLNEEMEEVFGPTPEGLTERVRERRSTHSQLAEREPEFVFADSPSDPSSWPKRDDVEVEPLAAGDSIQGLPGCPGVSEGVARVVLDSSDPTALGPGDVLVAPSTDPSWTPLFVPAGGVVVDVGAALSHAIIVSRELGIPCVVSATNATRRIRDGARVRVDGNTGAVTVLD
ncbi:MAG: PEP-utilizing enzyme [Actinomycetota bacterium]|nr:PEP-utilizing enzyme [Actinomycetota bacterium]MEC7665460.1 PEP-utilizing enzyme [Actinomycetota bacterium]MEC8019193.1 PEP-utilizing enzyme [Actinomycetota bacterium]MEC8464912.1 PEP-utilizing enzyme [Actinomycetota bacterium]MEC8503653.1 PEP-utilizing enzyme [Actinomycetota bacterium]